MINRHLNCLWLLLLTSSIGHASDWQATSRDSMGLSPLPAAETRAIVQVFAARTYGKRGCTSSPQLACHES